MHDGITAFSQVLQFLYRGRMRLLHIVLLTLVCTAGAGCSLARNAYLQDTAKQAIPLPDDRASQKLEIDPHFQESRVTLTYTTNKPPEQVLQWYRETLPAQGWQLASESDSDQLRAPRPNVCDRFLAQRNTTARQRLWIGLSSSSEYASWGKTEVRIQLESIRTLEKVERKIFIIIDAPLGFLDDSFPGVCWYFFWEPLKLIM